MIDITKENFITDERTNTVCYSSLLPTESSGLDSLLRKELYAALKETVKPLKNYELYNTRDIWARDYMPVQLTPDLFLNYTYNPDYLSEQKAYISNWLIHKVHIRQIEKFDFDVVTMPIVLDGGNIIKAIDKFGQPTIIMCSKVLTENNLSKKELNDWWNLFFDGRIRLILIDWEGKEDNPIGHADGMVRYISEGKVLITNYCDFDDEERLTKPLKEYFDIERLHFGDIDGIKDTKMWSLMKSKSWGYINFLQVGHHIVIPSLGWNELDNVAKQQIKDAFGSSYEIESINCDMTEILENPNENTNSGGGLNCLTWTLLSSEQIKNYGCLRHVQAAIIVLILKLYSKVYQF